MPESDFDMTLDELERKSVGRLLGADVFDLDAFLALHAYLCEKSERVKAEHTLSKQVVNCLRKAARLIESRAEYLVQVRPHAALANDFTGLLDIIAAGEAWSQYQPGVPRVQ